MRGKVIASVRSFAEVSRVIGVADGIEFRIDLFRKPPEFDRVRLKKLSIVTIRRVDEGGEFDGSEDERLHMLRNYSKYSDYVDLEHWVGDEVFKDVECSTIESFHDFKKTPSYEELRDFVESGRGDVLKIATMGRDKRDVVKITKILAEYDNVVAFLMGEEFAFTRILSVLLGSPFVYCSAGRSVAPGQFDVFKAVKILKELGLR